MKVEIYFFDITKPNVFFLLGWIKKHDVVISKHIHSIYDYHFQTDIKCYQLDDLITIRTLNYLNFIININFIIITKINMNCNSIT